MFWPKDILKEQKFWWNSKIRDDYYLKDNGSSGLLHKKKKKNLLNLILIQLEIVAEIGFVLFHFNQQDLKTKFKIVSIFSLYIFSDFD